MSYSTARNKWLVGQIWEINIHLSGKPFIPNCSFSKFFSHSTVRAIVFTWIFSQLSIMDPNGSWKGHSWFLVLDVNFVHSFLITYKPGRMKKIVGTCQTSCSSTVFPLPSQHLPYTELWDWHLKSQGWIQWYKDPRAHFSRTRHPQHSRWRKHKHWIRFWKFKVYFCLCHWISESRGSNSSKSVPSFIRCKALWDDLKSPPALKLSYKHIKNCSSKTVL